MYKISTRAQLVIINQLVIIKIAIFWNRAEFSHSLNRHTRHQLARASENYLHSEGGWEVSAPTYMEEYDL